MASSETKIDSSPCDWVRRGKIIKSSSSPRIVIKFSFFFKFPRVCLCVCVCLYSPIFSVFVCVACLALFLLTAHLLSVWLYIVLSFSL